MLKKILLIALFMFGVGCDKVTAPEKEVVYKTDTIFRNDTTKVQKVTISDTVLVQKKIISGKIVEKTSTGKVVGGFSSVVCSDSKMICTETNSSGEYYLNFENPIQKISARFLKEKDTTFDTVKTPEKIDTTKIDTVAKVSKIDSTKKDTIKITYRKYVPQSEPDTVVVYKDAKKIYETPITSWLNILPSDYVVQRNISGKIIPNAFVSELKDIEAVFWSLDSVALAIPLELNGSNYSGFIYQHYNDSSFKNSIRMYNLFVRILDTSDSVYGLTNVLNYSERSGDLVLSDLIPGSIARYPKPNYFRVFKDGDKISVIVDSIQKIVTNKKWYSLDSLYYRQLSKFNTIQSEQYKSTSFEWTYDSLTFNTIQKDVDSIGIYFESDSSYKTTYNAGKTIDVDINDGANFISYDKNKYQDLNSFNGSIILYTNLIRNFKVYVHLK